MGIFIALVLLLSPQGAVSDDTAAKAFEASYWERPPKEGPLESTPSKVYRDSSGRVRIDSFFRLGSDQHLFLRRIYDLPAGKMYVVGEPDKTIYEEPFPPGTAVSPLGSLEVNAEIPRDAAVEQLGSKEIEGLVCQGRRIGPLETWTSKELGIPILATIDGHFIMKIFDIKLVEPPPGTFALPEGYTLRQGDR